ncbi:hypothetical protein [Leucobacter luti]|uniref:Uncharacterized protein n=1 Tax=Leucobacter luti TaxID=340320 RepID=A0A4Q7U057_9MICO|nr:hypothetical protein [Leucobacter luti]MBL3699272.1 hypothetical protein [Leucobacter luti]RZT66781.1 hypothetical protein EV139_0908 [Leucobacter luti]
MQTKNLIQASATITRVAELKVGDVYKRLEESSYSGAKLKFGVVTGTLHNGDDAAITALEYEEAYSDGMNVELKVFGTSDDLKIFPSTREEFETHVAGLIGSTQRAVRDAEKKLEKAKQTRDVAESLLGMSVQVPTIADTAAPVLAE